MAWLNKPFLFPASRLARFLIAFLFGFFVFLFLRVFLPFGLDSIPVNKTLFILPYGCSTSLVIAVWLFVFPLFSPQMFDPDHYTIRKYLALCVGNTMLINTINWIYTRTAGAEFLPHFGFIPFTLITFSVGVFPVVFLTLMIDKLRLEIRTNQVIRAQLINPQRKEGAVTTRAVDYRDKPLENPVVLQGNDFICARSNGNYTMVYYRTNGTARKELIRTPLSAYFLQVANGSSIIRCHRSAVVDIRFIKQVIRKSRSVEFKLDRIEEPIPVSRELPREWLESPLCGAAVGKSQ